MARKITFYLLLVSFENELGMDGIENFVAAASFAASLSACFFLSSLLHRYFPGLVLERTGLELSERAAIMQFPKP